MRFHSEVERPGKVAYGEGSGFSSHDFTKKEKKEKRMEGRKERKMKEKRDEK